MKPVPGRRRLAFAELRPRHRRRPSGDRPGRRTRRTAPLPTAARTTPAERAARARSGACRPEAGRAPVRASARCDRGRGARTRVATAARRRRRRRPGRATAGPIGPVHPGAARRHGGARGRNDRQRASAGEVLGRGEAIAKGVAYRLHDARGEPPAPLAPGGACRRRGRVRRDTLDDPDQQRADGRRAVAGPRGRGLADPGRNAARGSVAQPDREPVGARGRRVGLTATVGLTAAVGLADADAVRDAHARDVPGPRARTGSAGRSRPPVSSAVSPASRRSTTCPGSASRSSGRTAASGPARRVSPTSPTSARSRPQTAFALASISKTYTAANALKLVEEGHLKLDDRAARYLPEFKLDPRITVRMLLDHTSGLRDFFLDRSIDAPAPGQARSAVDRDPDVALCPEAALPAGHALVLLEHQLPAARDDRGARRRPGARRPDPLALPGSAAPRPDVDAGRGGAADRGRDRSRTSLAHQQARDEAGADLRWPADHAVPLGRDGGRRGRRHRGHVPGRRPLDGGSRPGRRPEARHEAPDAVRVDLHRLASAPASRTAWASRWSASATGSRSAIPGGCSGSVASSARFPRTASRSRC